MALLLLLATHDTYMQRCLQLASLAQGYVAPNPMVGAVLVHNDRVIGEGYHRQYGQPHAEVNCISSVMEEDQYLISQSTLYVSLEPCAHWGKTPPCADLIIAKKIPKVVVGCRDPFEQVNGKGIEKLKAAGVEVVQEILEKECTELNKRFFTFHQKARPYIILKWAQSLNVKIAGNGKKRIVISGEASNRIVHKWRSQEAAIMVGTNTALYDNPQLGTRLWPGKNPVRIVLDMKLRLPASLQVFDGSIPTTIFGKRQHSLPNEKINAAAIAGVHYYQLTEENNVAEAIAKALYHLNMQSVLIEGGAQLLQSFIDAGLWDEARTITNEALVVGDGLAAPILYNQLLVYSESFATDSIHFYTNSVI